MVIAPARRAGDPGSIPGPGGNFSLKLLIIKICLDGTQSKVRIGNYLSCSFPTENGLKQGDDLSPLLLGQVVCCKFLGSSKIHY